MPETGFIHQLRIGMRGLVNLYRQRRKNLNENLGLIIAVAASGAAIWTGYEARHARLEARYAAEQSRKVQQDSVNAQIAAIRLDERPYVRVATIGIKMADELDRETYDYQAVFKLVAVGRTPATFLRWNVYCGSIQANQMTAIILDKSPGLTRTTSNVSVLNNAESIEANCPFSKETYRSGTNDVDIDVDNQTTDDKSFTVTFIVDVSYSDVFNTKHRTQQCFYVPTTGASPMRQKLLSCQRFEPIIE